jgi:hypothetical protein
MRTKTLALSSLVGMLGTVAALAQSTNVYSINSVGYINTTFPAGSYTILTCPLICGVDANGVTNSLNVLLSDTNGQYKHSTVYAFAGGTYTVTENGVGLGADPSGWSSGGSDISLMPGVACFFYNSTTAAMSATFVGTVPQTNNYNMTNALIPGYNLVGSIIPGSGSISTNPVMALTNIFKHDFVFTFDPTNGGYSGQDNVVGAGAAAAGSYINPVNNTGWVNGDPILDQVSYGFFYWNNQAAVNNWVENFTINP